MGFLNYALRRAIDRFVLLIALLILMWAIVEGLPERLTTHSTSDKLHHMELQHGWLLF
jgi:hypothetical protein